MSAQLFGAGVGRVPFARAKLINAIARDARGRDLGDAERALAAGLFGTLARSDIEAIERTTVAWGLEPLAKRARAAADVLGGGDGGR